MPKLYPEYRQSVAQHILKKDGISPELRDMLEEYVSAKWYYELEEKGKNALEIILSDLFDNKKRERLRREYLHQVKEVIKENKEEIVEKTEEKVEESRNIIRELYGDEEGYQNVNEFLGKVGWLEERERREKG